ncbi:MAG TPA: ABC transporter permease [Acidimicrobiales bacterium]|nr:ABC transporter permease [Acidimicrobiales bacterium]
MSGWRQGWLVARREMRERSRSRAFLISIVVMILAVTAMIVLPAVLSTSGGTKHVGFTGAIPSGLSQEVQSQGRSVGITVRIHNYPTLATGEQAVRDKHIDVLVVDTKRLEWPRKADDKLKAVVTNAIQVDAVRNRASVEGVSPSVLSRLLAPVAVSNKELGAAPGRSRDDESVALITAGLLLFCISTFGALVLSGVVEEKASRVVEVLLTRVSSRNLLAGKIAGIGLLGFAQIAIVAIVALIATTAVSSVNLPAVRAGVAVWVLVWFVLGYALYATAFGTLGSLASRVEDAQSVAGPVTVLLLVGFFVAFAAIGSPSTRWATVVSLIPLTAPMAMPGRIAMGVAPWWQPALAVLIALVTIVALVYYGGRLYVRAILHSGATLSLRDAWLASTTRVHEATNPQEPKGRSWLTTLGMTAQRRNAMARNDQAAHPLLYTVITCIGVAVGVAVAVIASDVIAGVIAGSLLIFLAVQIAKLWTGRGTPSAHQH